MNYLDYYEKCAKADSEIIKNVMKEYIRYFELEKCKYVLDVGCGRGEFLELLEEKNIKCLGIDIDSNMIDFCQKKNLPVKKYDILSFLASNTEKFDGIFASHFVEHLEIKEIEILFKRAYSSLEDNGIFILSFPNSRSIMMHLYHFYSDPTHKRFYSPELIEFLLKSFGFKIEESKGNPTTSMGKLLTIEIPINDINKFDHINPNDIFLINAGKVFTTEEFFKSRRYKIFRFFFGNFFHMHIQQLTNNIQQLTNNIQQLTNNIQQLIDFNNKISNSIIAIKQTLSPYQVMLEESTDWYIVARKCEDDDRRQ